MKRVYCVSGDFIRIASPLSTVRLLKLQSCVKPKVLGQSTFERRVVMDLCDKKPNQRLVRNWRNGLAPQILRRPAFRLLFALNHDLNILTKKTTCESFTLFSQKACQLMCASGADGFRKRAPKRRRQCPRAFRIGKDMRMVERKTAEKAFGRHKVKVRLVREARHHVTAEAEARQILHRRQNQRLDIPHEVRAPHRRENAIRAGLHGNVKKTADIRRFRHRANGLQRTCARLNGPEPNAASRRNRRKRRQEVWQTSPL